MFTGLRPDSTGILNLHTYMRDINPDVITLPQFFRDQGYVTVGYGNFYTVLKMMIKNNLGLNWVEIYPSMTV